MREVNFAEYITPTRDYVVVELVKEEETAGGVMIPEHLQEETLGLPVAATGPDVKGIEIGDLVMPVGLGNTMSIFGKEYLWVESYNVLAIVKPEAAEINTEIKREKAKHNDAIKKRSMGQIIGPDDIK